MSAIHGLITINKEILSGTPVIAGTRVPVKNLFDYLETGESMETFLQDFPMVKKDQAVALLMAAQKLLTVSSEVLYIENDAIMYKSRTRRNKTPAIVRDRTAEPSKL